MRLEMSTATLNSTISRAIPADKSASQDISAGFCAAILPFRVALERRYVEGDRDGIGHEGSESGSISAVTDQELESVNDIRPRIPECSYLQPEHDLPGPVLS